MRREWILLQVAVTGLLLLLGAVFLTSCATTTETASKDTLTTHVGEYPPPPAGMERVRVGVPPFEVKPAHVAGEQLENLAADELTTLAFRTHRFDVIERTQLEQLLREQGLEGVVRPEELAAKGRVHGVDYLFIGKVTNFRVKEDETTTGAGVGRLASLIGGVDVERSKKRIQIDCGVDLRLVDPADGSLLAANFGEYKRTDTVSALGVEVLGAGVRSEGDLRVSKENRGKILRLALDDAVRKMLSDIDHNLEAASGSRSQGSAQQREGVRFCPQCGAKVDSEAKFCSECGASLE